MAPHSPGRLLARTQHRLKPDASRTLCQLFVPGQETLIRGESRAMAVIDRVLGMSERDVDRTLARTLVRFSDRYRDLQGILEHNFGLIAHRLGAQTTIGDARRQLIGAFFTQEYALEAAALFNPSIVAHPDQAGCAPGEVRFAMSLRAVGEGHRSSIEFRSGTIGSDGEVCFDLPGRFLDTGCQRPVPYDRRLFQEKFAELGYEDEDARYLWSRLPSRFTAAELDAALAELSSEHVTRGDSAALADAVRWMAASNYAVEFDERHALSERVLWPARPRATVWRMRDSCASPVQMAQFITRHTRRSMARESSRTFWKPGISGRSLSPSSQAPRPAIKAWRCFPGRLVTATPRSLAGTGKATRSDTQTTVIAGPRPSPCRRRLVRGS